MNCKDIAERLYKYAHSHKTEGCKVYFESVIFCREENVIVIQTQVYQPTKESVELKPMQDTYAARVDDWEEEKVEELLQEIFTKFGIAF